MKSINSGCCMAALSLSCAVNAQTQPPAVLERVLVTGSNIPQADEYGASPVQVFTREDIQRRGVTTLQELLSSISNVGGGFTDVGGIGTFAPGASGAILRGLGLQQTLVLLNGRRVAPYPLAQYSDIFTNIDALPFAAIERVEILRSGGAALYGSEAIAGVINVITRADYEGLALKASHQHSMQNQRFRSNSVSLAGGVGNLAEDRYNLLFSAEVFRRQNVIWRDVLSDVNPQLTAPFPSFGTSSSFSYPGNVLPNGAIPGCDPQLVIGGLCRYDRYQRFEAVPAAERFNFTVAGQWKLDAGTTGFAELLSSNTRTDYVSVFRPYGPALGDVIWGDPSTGQQRSFTFRGLPAGHPLNPTGQDDADFRYRFVDAPSGTVAKAHQYRLLTGLKGGDTGLSWEAATGVMGGHARFTERGSFSASGFREVIGNDDPSQTDPLFFQRGYRIGQANSAEVIDRLFPETSYRGSTTQVFVDGKVATEVARIDDRPVSLATGAELRRERFAVKPSENLLAGDIVGNGLVASDASRFFSAVFAELNLPVTQSLQLQTAGRLDKFPGLGPQLSPKLGLRFEASPQLLLRGTVEAGFRAPNLSESATSTKFDFIAAIPDPKRCTQAQALATDLRAAGNALPANDPQRTVLLARADIVTQSECTGSAASIVRNNPDLKPETSRNATLGLVWHPVRSLALTLDYWSIRRKNEIALKSRGDILVGEDSNPGDITRAGLAQDRTFSAAEQARYGVTAGALTSVTGRFENLARSKTSGIDFGARGAVPTPLGPLDVAVNGTYQLDVRSYSTARNGYGDNLARNGRVRTDVTGSLATGPLTNTLTWNYVSGSSLNGDFDDTQYTQAGCAAKGWTPEQCHIGSTIRLDYQLAYTASKQLTLSLNVRNLLNRRPPVNLRGLLEGGGGIIPQGVADVEGRMVRVTAELTF